jgi:histidinol dehydrogenase
VLPTGGAARFSSGLSVKDFLKWSSTIKRENGGSKAVGAAKILAQSEGLAYHALSLE